MADIVVGVDGSDGSRAALRWALAEAFWHDCDVVAVCGWARGGLESADQRARLDEAARRMLRETVARVSRETALPFPPTTGAGTATAVRVTERTMDRPGSEALLSIGRDARMIVVGARGRGLLHRLRIGSVSASIAVHARVPVVIARGSGPSHPAGPRADAGAAPVRESGTGDNGGAGDGHDGRPGRGHAAARRSAGEATDGTGGVTPARPRGPVAVGVDGSPNSLAALGWAAEEARLRGVPLIVVHAWLAAIPLPFAEAPAQITQALEDQARCVLDESIAAVPAARSAGLDLRRVIVASSATQALLAHGHTCELVVVGARGHGGFAELLLGSVSHQCMLHCAAPVAIIHGT